MFLKNIPSNYALLILLATYLLSYTIIGEIPDQIIRNSSVLQLYEIFASTNNEFREIRKTAR